MVGMGYTFKLETIKTPWEPDGVAWLPTRDAITGKTFWLKRKCVRHCGVTNIGVSWAEYTTETNAAWDRLSNAD